MRDLCARVNAGVLTITHYMGVVVEMSDRIAAMQQGRIVERGMSDKLFNHAQRPTPGSCWRHAPHFGSVTAAEAAERTDASLINPA